MPGHPPLISVRVWLLGVLAFWLAPSIALCQEPGSLTSQTILRVLLLKDYNTRVVLLGTALLGMSGGIVGVFMLLRKRSLIGDVVGHSALPGIAIAFIVSQLLWPGSGKSLPILMLGALTAGLLGAWCVMLIERYSRIRSDAALAITLSLFYGLGTALLTVIQRMPTGSAAGLQTYLNGKTASLLREDVQLFSLAALLLILLTLTLFKEFTLLCFDDVYAGASGWPIFWLDGLLIGLVAGVTIVGMQTVGLILVVAILIIPAASARFWTDDVRWLTASAAGLGTLSASLGTLLSALAPRLAAGAIIVLSGTALFIVSLLLGTRRGLVWRWLDQRRLRQRIGQHDLLRAIFERIESVEHDRHLSEQQLLQARLTVPELLAMRSWNAHRLQELIRRALRMELLIQNADQSCGLTPDGAALARRAVRNHRLWEIYLITHADIAPSQADYDADRIEHVLSPEVIRELEVRLVQQDDQTLPPSPHRLQNSHSENPINQAPSDGNS